MEICEAIDHFIDDSTDLNATISSILGRLQKLSDESQASSLLAPVFDLLRAVLHHVNDRVKRDVFSIREKTSFSNSEAFQKLKQILKTYLMISGMDASTDYAMESMCGLYCEFTVLSSEPHWLIDRCLAALKTGDFRDDTRMCRNAIEVLNCLLFWSNSYSSMKESLKASTDSILEALSFVLDTECLGKFCIVVQKLLKVEENNSERLKMIWNITCGQKTKLNDSLIILCTLAGFYIGSNENCVEIYQDSRYWKLIQSGLGDSDTLSRKRALYCLKRALDNLTEMDRQICAKNGPNDSAAIFHWDVDEKVQLTTLWEDFVLIAEMMEEKQVHVIRPLLPRWQNLVDSTVGGNDLTPLLHTSWLVVLLKRTSVHSSSIIVKWGMDQLLDLDATEIPLIAQGANEFMTSHLAEMLNQSALYQRDLTTPIEDCPPIAEKLVTFLQCYWSAFSDERSRARFFNELVLNIDSVSWSGIPLMFVTRALSTLPRGPVLDRPSVDVLRNICTQHIRTVYTNQRGAIQVFSTQTMTKLLDPEKTDLMDVLRFLSVVRPEESFTRGSRVWMQLCDWLKKKPWSDTMDQLQLMMAALISKEPKSKYSELSSETLSRGFVKLLLLHLDCGAFDIQPESFCFPLFDIASSAVNRPYLSRESADNALGAIVQIVELKGKLNLDPALQRLLDQSRPSLQEYAIQRLLSCTSLDISEFYLSAVYQLATPTDKNYNMTYVSDVAEKLSKHVSKAGSADPAEVVVGLMAIRGLAQCVRAIEDISFPVSAAGDFKIQFPKMPPLSDIYMNIKRPESGQCGVDSRGWTGLISATVEARWQIVAYNLEHSFSEKPSEELLQKCLASMDEGTNRILEPVFRTIGLNFGALDIDKDSISNCIGICWRRLVECGPCPQAYWPAYCTFVKMCYQKKLMEIEDLKDVLLNLADKIQTAAVDRIGVMYHLTAHWISILSTVDLEPFVQQLVKMAMFGPVHKKGDKIVQDMNVYVETLEELEPGRIEIDRDDTKVRVLMTIFLLQIDRNSTKNQDLLMSFAEAVIEAWREITRTRRRHTFVNSLRHRETHRLLTSLLLVYDVMTGEKLETLLEFLGEVLEQEGQPSVRFLAEWIMILVLVKNREKWSLVWDNLSKGHDKKPALQCSWLTIVTHCSRLVPKNDRIEFLKKAIPAVLPLCMAHQFNLRIFGQASLLAIWKQCEDEGLEKFSQAALVLDSVHNFLSMSGNSTKVTKTLLDHFSLVYHPLEDLSIQTLFVTVHKLFGLNRDEWLYPIVFKRLDPEFWESTDLRVPLLNVRTVLDDCKPHAWRIKMDEGDGDDVTTSGDVQRKITPWRRMFPDEDYETSSTTRKKPANEGLILVASLIDKATNLGGLCRTCEIFGVKEFVVGSLEYVQDPQFVGLSVSAQKWIPITEVMPHTLREYLLAQQRHGYTLVGVEQTNNSKCLSDFKFPDKTVLVLGNEKEGIPVDLIQLLDVCVEIPQQGIIRSLNVHVCGALLMWEYRRQHLL